MNQNNKINIAINVMRYFHFQEFPVRNTIEPRGSAMLKIGRY